MLTHYFLHQSYDIQALLKNTNKLSTFCTKLEKQSTQNPNACDPEKYKGNGLELLVEYLLKSSPVDNRLGISQYQPVQEGDIGVDGFGIGTNGNPATVQVKYRTNTNTSLTANKDHLSNFVVASQNTYEVPVKDTNNMLVITTAKGLHHFTDNEMFGNKVRCIGYEQLRSLVDNNIPFWDGFRNHIK